MIQLSGPSQIITGDEILTVFREGPFNQSPIELSDSVYLDGKPVKRGITTFTITCTTQPITGRDLLMVPEGDRYKENYWLWQNVTTPVNQASPPAALIINDRVIMNNINYQVQEVQPWGSFQQCRIMRTDTGPFSNSGPS